MAKKNKAKLSKKLNELRIPIPRDATVSQLQFRLDNWLGGNGFLVRRFRVMRGKESVAKLIELGKTYWVPNSHFAHDIIKSRLVFTVGRSPTPPADAVFLDVPEWYGNDEEE
tara:strand:- start:444 stop:779 length:336 start_codon:yes stop_codon:yes gene_type:complete